MPLSTGIPKLDEYISGGFPSGSKVLISATPGIESRVFAYQIIQANKGKATYLIENAFPAQIRRDIVRYIFPEAQFKSMSFIDCFSTALGLPSTEKNFAKDSTKIEHIEKAIADAVTNEKPEILIVDSLFGLESKNKTIEPVLKQLDNATKKGIVVVCLYTKWDEKNNKKLEENFDYVIELRSIEERFLTRSYLNVKKAPQLKEKIAIPFRIGFDGIAVYIPKVIVTGPFHAGKSTFIHKISSKAISVNRMGTTIALDHGYVEHGGFSVDLFGTPGQERFEFMLDILNKDAFGVILVVDSTKPETFERAKEMLAHVSKYNLPYIIVANKQDMKSALKPSEVKKMLGLKGDVIGAVATEGNGCLDALKKLIDKIVAGENYG